MYVSDLQPGSLKPCGHDDNGVILLLQTLSVLKSYMKEIARYVDSASQQGSGGIRRRDLAESRTVTPDLAVHPPAGGQLVQVLGLSTAYVLESKIPTEWRNVTSNYRIRSFNVQAREVRRLAAVAHEWGTCVRFWYLQRFQNEEEKALPGCDLRGSGQGNRAYPGGRGSPALLPIAAQPLDFASLPPPVCSAGL